MNITDIKALIVSRINGGSNTVAKERELWNILVDELIKLFEVKEIAVNLTTHPTYLVDNFDTSGLGKNSMVGFAIANGNNGTYNYSGKVAVGYGAGYATLGATGGSKDAVVVDHDHDYTQYELDQEVSTNGNGVKTIKKTGVQGATVFKTVAKGVSGVNKNMQPYIVVLKIQRIN